MKGTVAKFRKRNVHEQLFALGQGGLPPEVRQEALTEFRRYVEQQKRCFLGYQANQRLDLSKDLARYLNCQLNNLGDPFKDGNFTLNTKCMERAVLDYFARLWHAVRPYDKENPESYWGYVVSMGSSEANLYGLWNARDYLAGKVLLDDSDVVKVNLDDDSEAPEGGWTYQRAAAPEDNPWAYSPVAFYSEDSHYSITKASMVLGLKTFYQMGNRYFRRENPLDPGKPWPREVPSNSDGSIDLDKLKILVEFFARRGYPILVSFNYGTTFKGAYDDVHGAGELLMPVFERYGLAERQVLFDPKEGQADTRTGFWFHVDGALGAAYMPFREMAHERGLVGSRGPVFDFRLPFVHSISMSGHKWIGAPWPCGVFMTKRKYQLLPPEPVIYTGSPDTTFAGSRNGFSALLLWDYLARYSYDRNIQKLVEAEELAQYAVERLHDLERKLKDDLWIERSPLALTVRFKKAHESVIFKYSLSGDRIRVNGKLRDYSHIFLMEHVTRELIDSLVKDLGRKGRFPEQPPPPSAPTPLPVSRKAAAGTPISALPKGGRGFR